MNLRPRDVVKLSGLSRSAVYKAVASGELPARRYKGKQGRKGALVITPADYDAWVGKHFVRIVNER